MIIEWLLYFVKTTNIILLVHQVEESCVNDPDIARVRVLTPEVYDVIYERPLAFWNLLPPFL